LLNTGYTLTGAQAGIRPSVRDRRPLIGIHPEFPNVSIFNGLGTKGVTLAPFFAKELVEHLDLRQRIESVSEYKKVFFVIFPLTSALSTMSIRYIYTFTFSIGLLAFLGLFTESLAQRYPSQETFGKNRVQYKTFNWKIFRTTNFEIYHYQGGTALAKLTAQYAESEFDKITDVLGWTPYSRVKIFLVQLPGGAGTKQYGGCRYAGQSQ
jgi:hypothetical protein